MITLWRLRSKASTQVMVIWADVGAQYSSIAVFRIAVSATGYRVLRMRNKLDISYLGRETTTNLVVPFKRGQPMMDHAPCITIASNRLRGILNRSSTSFLQFWWFRRRFK